MTDSTKLHARQPSRQRRANQRTLDKPRTADAPTRPPRPCLSMPASGRNSACSCARRCPAIREAFPRLHGSVLEPDSPPSASAAGSSSGGPSSPPGAHPAGLEEQVAAEGHPRASIRSGWAEPELQPDPGRRPRGSRRFERRRYQGPAASLFSSRSAESCSWAILWTKTITAIADMPSAESDRTRLSLIPTGARRGGIAGLSYWISP